MSYDLGVFDPAIGTLEQAHDWSARLEASAPTGAGYDNVESAPVRAFMDELSAKWPDLNLKDPARTVEVPWNSSFRTLADGVYLTCDDSRADEVNAFVHVLSERYGCSFYDPQLDSLWAAGAQVAEIPPPVEVRSPWWKRLFGA